MNHLRWLRRAARLITMALTLSAGRVIGSMLCTLIALAADSWRSWTNVLLGHEIDSVWAYVEHFDNLADNGKFLPFAMVVPHSREYRIRSLARTLEESLRPDQFNAIVDGLNTEQKSRYRKAMMNMAAPKDNPPGSDA